jgi:predicted Zn-dependent protease with MMP-like domain
MHLFTGRAFTKLTVSKVFNRSQPRRVVIRRRGFIHNCTPDKQNIGCIVAVTIEDSDHWSGYAEDINNYQHCVSTRQVYDRI